MTPLALLHVASGAHHDAIVAGLVVAGLAVALRRPGPAGAVAAGAVVGLAAAVKVTAVVALPFAALLAAGASRRLPDVARHTGAAAAGALAAFAALTLAAGLDLGWVRALTGTSELTQWTSPPTGVGMAAGYVLRAAGWAGGYAGAVTVARVAGLIVLAIVLLVLWIRAARPPADAPRTIAAAGWALAAVVLLAPVLYPWYALVPLAVLALALPGERTRQGLAVATARPEPAGLPRRTRGSGADQAAGGRGDGAGGRDRRMGGGQARPETAQPAAAGCERAARARSVSSAASAHASARSPGARRCRAGCRPCRRAGGQPQPALQRPLHHPHALDPGVRHERQVAGEHAVAGGEHLGGVARRPAAAARAGAASAPAAAAGSAAASSMSTPGSTSATSRRAVGQVADRQQPVGLAARRPGRGAGVPGHVEAQPQPAQRPPQQRPGGPDRLHPVERHGLAAGLQQAVPQPQAGLVVGQIGSSSRRGPAGPAAGARRPSRSACWRRR